MAGDYVYCSERATGVMGAFIFGLIIGFVAAIALVIYDEGEVFLRLGQQIKMVAGKYKQQTEPKAGA
jgi:hypothetical protein